MTLDEMRALAVELPGGEHDVWRVALAHDHVPLLWTGDDEWPLALIYGGNPLARYLLACAPGVLLRDNP